MTVKDFLNEWSSNNINDELEEEISDLNKKQEKLKRQLTFYNELSDKSKVVIMALAIPIGAFLLGGFAKIFDGSWVIVRNMTTFGLFVGALGGYATIYGIDEYNKNRREEENEKRDELSLVKSQIKDDLSLIKVRDKILSQMDLVSKVLERRLLNEDIQLDEDIMVDLLEKNFSLLGLFMLAEHHLLPSDIEEVDDADKMRELRQLEAELLKNMKKELLSSSGLRINYRSQARQNAILEQMGEEKIEQRESASRRR